MLRLPVVIAIMLSAVASLRSRAWGPILIALTVALAGDMIAERAALSSRPDMILWLLTPAVSAWCASVVLGRVAWLDAAVQCAAGWFVASLIVSHAGTWLWGAIVPCSLLASLIGQSAALVSWAWRDDLGTTADAAAIGLLAGDALILLGHLLPLPKWWPPWQAAGVATLLVVYQIRCEIQSRRR